MSRYLNKERVRVFPQAFRRWQRWSTTRTLHAAVWV